MEQYIVGLFQDISILTLTLLCAGVLLCIIEVFVPKFGMSGVLGIALVVFGMSSYYIDGFKLKQMVGILSIISLVLAIFIFIELVLEGKGVIHNPHRYKFRTYNQPDNDLANLVGQTGKAISNIDLGGTIEIDGKLYYAVSNLAIAAGTFVQVIGVQNNALVVKVN